MVRMLWPYRLVLCIRVVIDYDDRYRGDITFAEVVITYILLGSNEATELVSGIQSL
jgi:hypothetical protein